MGETRKGAVWAPVPLGGTPGWFGEGVCANTPNAVKSKRAIQTLCLITWRHLLCAILCSLQYFIVLAGKPKQSSVLLTSNAATVAAFGRFASLHGPLSCLLLCVIFHCNPRV